MTTHRHFGLSDNLVKEGPPRDVDVVLIVSQLRATPMAVSARSCSRMMIIFLREAHAAEVAAPHRRVGLSAALDRRAPHRLLTQLPRHDAEPDVRAASHGCPHDI
jgi:CRISPR/Cas system-associated endonuclease Cas1